MTSRGGKRLRSLLVGIVAVMIAVAAAWLATRQVTPRDAPDGPVTREVATGPAQDAPRDDARLPLSTPSAAGAGASGPPRDAAAGSIAAAGEEALMTRLRDVVDARPTYAVELAQEGERRWPGGRHADERSFLKMRALVHLGDIAPARDEAEAFFERFGTRNVYAERVARLTGVHPRPGGRR